MDLKPPTVSIVLATFNGAAFLQAQLRSLKTQDYKAWRVILSDDGSSDRTLEIARDCIDPQKLCILHGPQAGAAQNFWHGLMQVPRGSYLAFCDQDDVWLPNKLSRAVSRIGGVSSPTLYSSGRSVTNCNLIKLYEQRRRRVTSFTRLFFRNPIAGHTCVLNPQAVDILKTFPPPLNVPFHDWWAALVLKAMGTNFLHDPKPSLLYRQHQENVLGAHGSRVRLLTDGTYLRWLKANYTALNMYKHRFSPQLQRALGVCLPSHSGLSLRQR